MTEARKLREQLDQARAVLAGIARLAADTSWCDRDAREDDLAPRGSGGARHRPDLATGDRVPRADAMTRRATISAAALDELKRRTTAAMRSSPRAD